MKVYRIEPNPDNADDWQYADTKSSAHSYAKAMPKHQWDTVRIVELELQSDKEGVIAALNRQPIYEEVQAWGLTKRGGLEEWKE